MEEMRIDLAGIADLVGGKCAGKSDLPVRGLQNPGGRIRDRIVVCRDKKSRGSIEPGVPLVCREGELPEGFSGVEVKDIDGAFVRILEFFSIRETPPRGVHPLAFVEPGAAVSPTASIGPLCFLSKGCEICDDAVLEGQVFIGPGVVVGKRTKVEAGAVIRDGSVIGDECIIHSGAVIGCDGFGFQPDFENGHVKIPQIGIVRLGDRVEVGACVSIDRATIDETFIGSGTVIDDHVHVGHNAKIGEKCIIIAMTGIAGSAVLEDGVIMAARSGVADHVTVGRRAQVAACGGATRDVPPGATVSGFPARDHREELKKQALLRKLPDLMGEIKALRAEIEVLKGKINGQNP